MEDNKTLVEQLREIADDHNCGAGCRLRSEFCSKQCDDYISCHNCTGDALHAIADRIENEYMPLPMLEGEPLKVGDKVDGYGQDGAEVFGVMNSVMVFVRSTVKGGHGYHDEAYPLLLWCVDDLKRHRQEVLDADGVPIIVGDVVYFVDSAEAFDVLRIESDGDEPVHIGRKDRTSTDAWVSPGDLTHKQPDTMERIDADAKKSFTDYWGCSDADCRCCPAMVGGEKPYERYETTNGCLIAQRLDLLRRQREVLERGHE